MIELQKFILLAIALLGNNRLLGLSVRDLPPAEKIVSQTESFTILSLADKGLTSLEGLDEMENIENVTYLVLENNQLSTLPAKVFSCCPDLKVLMLGENRLDNISPEAFANLTDLRALYLNDNSLEELPSSLFDSLTNLRDLDMSNNQITSLSPGIFDPLVQLKRLSLEGNKLTTLPDGIFNTCTNLETLILSNNELSTLPVGMIDGLANLQTLYLDYNRLTIFQINPIRQRLPVDATFYGGDQEVPPLVLEPNISEQEWQQLTEEEQKESCSICLDPIEQAKAYKTVCGHRFHAECLAQWLEKGENTSCPICRADIFTGQSAQPMPGAIAHNDTLSKKRHRIAKRREKKNGITIAKRSKKKKTLHVAWHKKTLVATRSQGQVA